MPSIRLLILGPAATLLLGLATESAWASRKAPPPAPTAPACTPATLDNSAVLAGSVSVSPLPGSRDASPRTQVSFLGPPARELSAISVVGSRTGAHSGRLLAYSQSDGASFLPGRPFAEGELVTVRARLRTGSSTRQLLDQFVVAEQDSISSTPEATHPGAPSEVQSFHSRPDLRPPVVTVTAQSPAAAAGDVLVAPYTGPGQAGPMILDGKGGLLWFKPLPANVFATNLEVQEYGGRPVLTWWQGNISVHGFGLGEGVIEDSSYSLVAHVRAGNGQQADLHELQLTPQGTALITAYAPILCNLSHVGGPSYGAVTDGMIQEIDVKTGLVEREWTSLDHVALGESFEAAGKSSTVAPYDFFHINSIDRESDGSLLTSGRNTWAIYDIDGRSGQVAWRLGGKKSSFKGAADIGTAWQHDPRLLPNGTISLFDNGASPKVHSQSRGVVLSLDAAHKTATLVSQFVHTPSLVAESQGNMQALANGDWFVGWGQEPDFSELSPEGQLLFDAHFPRWTQSYRSFRQGWTGNPVHGPTLVFQPGAGASPATVYASWNGATLVSSWRVLAGPSPTSLSPVTQALRNGFETAIGLPAGAGGPYLAVQALDARGQVLGVSTPTLG
jgi:hypothetical protein